MKASGATVLVTGASNGIGAATARAIARAGWRVLLLARTQSAPEEAAAEIASNGGERCSPYLQAEGILFAARGFSASR